MQLAQGDRHHRRGRRRLRKEGHRRLRSGGTKTLDDEPVLSEEAQAKAKAALGESPEDAPANNPDRVKLVCVVCGWKGAPKTTYICDGCMPRDTLYHGAEAIEYLALQKAELEAAKLAAANDGATVPWVVIEHRKGKNRLELHPA